jgi:hypothetical protein
MWVGVYNHCCGRPEDPHCALYSYPYYSYLPTYLYLPLPCRPLSASPRVSSSAPPTQSELRQVAPLPWAALEERARCSRMHRPMVSFRSQTNKKNYLFMCFVFIVHFPTAKRDLVKTRVTHSPASYDRSPIVVVPNSCALPARGCPGSCWALV